MAITKEKKVAISEKLDDILKDVESLVFVHFNGLDVGSETEMRKTLLANDVKYFVAKKTLMKRALESKKYDGERPVLEGEIALAYGNDLVAPAREVHAFVKKHKDNLSIVGGVFEGKYMDAEEMQGIATIPSLEVLYGQVVNLINSPIQGLVMALDQIAKKQEA